MDDTLSPSSPLGKRLLHAGFSSGGKKLLSKREALKWAVRGYRVSLVEQLIDAGTDVNSKEDCGENAFQLAAEAGACDVMLMLHKAGAAVEIRNRDDQTPLHFAATKGQYGAVRLLVGTFKVQVDPRDKDGRTPLTLAVRANQCDIIRLLREFGADISTLDNDQDSLLHHACRTGCPEAAKLLVDWGLSTSLVNDSNHTPLNGAALYDEPELVRYLIGIGADVSTKSILGRTPLHQAAWLGYATVAEALLECDRVCLDEKDATGDTALSLAAYRGNNAIVKMLVEKGAALDTQDHSGNSPLHNATRGHSHEVIEFLIEKGAQIEAKNSVMSTPLLVAARHGTLGVVRLLEDHGADLHITNETDNTVLLESVLSEDEGLVRHFIRRGVSLETKSTYGQTALSRAAEAGLTDIVEVLIQSSADMETEGSQVGKEQWRPLHYAAFQGHRAVVEILLENGADGSAKDKNGRVAQFYAEREGHSDVAEILRRETSISRKRLQDLENQPTASFIKYAASGDLVNVARRIKEGIDVDKMDQDGRRAAIEAAKHGYNVVMLDIYDKGGHPDEKDVNGMTALWWACWNNFDHVVPDLLARGAGIDEADSEGQTPLAVASLCGNTNIVELLLKHGANPNSSVAYGKTPLLFAVDEGHVSVVELLLQANADLNYKMPTGETALSLAESNGDKDIVEILERYQAPGKDCLIPDGIPEGPQTKTEFWRTERLADAAKLGRVPEIIRLVKHGADINRHSNDAVPIIEAARARQINAITTLISLGAQVDARDKVGLTAMHHAAYRGHSEVIRLLYDAGSNLGLKDKMLRTPLSYAAEEGQEQTAKLLLELEAKLDPRDMQGRTPLWYAAEQGHVGMVDILASAGASINHIDKSGYTPLCIAVERHKFQMVRLLLKKRAQMTPIFATNLSPLCLAAKNGDEQIVDLLIEHRADVNHLSNSRQTPLIKAAISGNSMVVKLLVEMGARTGIKDDYGRTALSYAKEYQRRSIVNSICMAASLRERNERAVRRVARTELIRRALYRYRPLTRGRLIRVLKLKPGKWDDIISFDLVVVDLDQKPSFEALSYEWKERTGTIPVQCGQDRIYVTPNCKAALENLRFKEEVRTLWIDAVCINQNAKQEVNQQVAMMTDIYRNAKRVIMWLGNEDDYTKTAFNSLESFITFQKSPSGKSRKSGNQAFDVSQTVDAIHNEWEKSGLKRDTVIRSVERMYYSSYFKRAWIFQEIILAGSRGFVTCGTYCCSWARLQRALMGFRWYQRAKNVFDGIGPYGMPDNRCFTSIVEIGRRFRRKGGADITATIGAMATFQATDLRDKVFATLRLGSTLLSAPQMKPPAADYEKTVQQVYVGAAQYYVDVRGSPGWSYGNRPSKKVVPELPSWVSDCNVDSRLAGLRDPFHIEHELSLSSLVKGRPGSTTAVSLHIDAYVMDHVVYKVSITKERDVYDIVKGIATVLAKQGRSLYDPYPPQSNSPVAIPEDWDDTLFGAVLQALFKDLFRPDYETDDESGSDCHDDSGKEADNELTIATASIESSSISSLSTHTKCALFASFLAWMLSQDDTAPDLCRHMPPYLKGRVDILEGLTEDDDEYLGTYEDLEDSLRYDTDIIYTSNGWFGLSNGGEAEEGLVVALIRGEPRLSLLRPRSNGPESWYEYVDDVHLTHLLERPDSLRELDPSGRRQKIEIR